MGSIISSVLPFLIPAVIVIAVIVVLCSGYLKAPPDMAYLISGVGKKPRILIGKAGIKIPFFERVDRLFLGAIQIDVKTSSSVPTAEFINVKVDSYQWNTGAHTGSTQKSDSTSPTFALSYSPDDKVTVYANHAESFDKGARVPGSANGNILENHDEMLSPTKTKQNEIGVKYQNKGILTTLSLFNLKQAANMDVQKDGKWYRVQDGENEFKGIELTVNGKIADKWNAMGGITYLNGKVNRSASVASGTKINGTPKWNGVMSLEYQADDDFSVLGRALYFGDCTIQNERLEVPSYLTFDLGVKYKTKVSHTPVTLSAMCYNLTGKDYWITSGNTTILSNPRTFMLSAEFDL